MTFKIHTALLMGGICLSFTACSEEKKTTQLANLASVNCAEKGGTLRLSKKPDGGEYGVCFFEDARQCEEWALLRGQCPEGGIKVTGYTTPEGVYCAITGGQVLDNETKCKTPLGTTCEAKAFYDGTCK